jgi:hypothetical protein
VRGFSSCTRGISPPILSYIEEKAFGGKNERNQRKNDVVLGGAKYRRGTAIATRAWREHLIMAKTHKLFAAVFRKSQ